MADEIKGVFVKDNALHFVRGSEVWSVKDNGKEPNQWEQVHFANVGTSVMEGLMPAFEHLRKIRQSVSTPIPELNRRQL